MDGPPLGGQLRADVVEIEDSSNGFCPIENAKIGFDRLEESGVIGRDEPTLPHPYVDRR
ncbi:MAG: hypothetical protein ACOCY7_00470 [Halodesulfurarchaeum sp.]